MKNNLFTLQQLVHAVAAPTSPAIDETDEAYFKNVKERAHAVAETIRRKLISKAGEILTPRKLTTFIQGHQRHFIMLADDLTKGLPFAVLAGFGEINSGITRLDLVKECYRCIERLLNYLFRHFPGNVCMDMKMPDVQKAMMAENIIDMHQKVRVSAASAYINEQLRQLLQDVITEYTSSTSALTYRRAAALQAFLGALLSAAGSGSEHIQRELHAWLCMYNVNHPKVYLYYTERISRKAAALASKSDQASLLHLIRKRINQLNYDTGHACESRLPSLQDQLNSWIDEEVHFLEKSSQQPEGMLTGQEIPGDGKIKLNMNAQELACMLHLAYESGMVAMNSRLLFLKLAAQAFSTNNKGVIKADSAYTSFYNIKPSTMEVVREKLMAMVNMSTKKMIELRKKVVRTKRF